MKSFIYTLGIVCVAALTGTFIYLNYQKRQPVARLAVVEPLSHQTTASPKKDVVPVQRKQRSASIEMNETKQHPVEAVAPTEVKVDEPPKATPLSQTVDIIVSSQSSYEQRQAAWKQLRDANLLDQAIEVLKRGAASDTNSAEYPGALGQAYLQKAGVVSRSGGNLNELGILGMQADKSFDAALKLNRSNWEAQFFKAASLSHWPKELNKSDEVVQRFASLIDQQETMTQQPEFAKTYVLLGEQYQKMGKPEYAIETWKLGAAKFPADAVLLKKVSGQ